LADLPALIADSVVRKSFAWTFLATTNFVSTIYEPNTRFATGTVQFRAHKSFVWTFLALTPLDHRT
jgi:hypothetical protein